MEKVTIAAKKTHLENKSIVFFIVSGEVSERLKEHAWRACVQKCTRGSNPRLSANYKKSRLEIGCNLFSLRHRTSPLYSS